MNLIFHEKYFSLVKAEGIQQATKKLKFSHSCKKSLQHIERQDDEEKRKKKSNYVNSFLFYI